MKIINKKGFTIVELVIVIAVIAILAAVMIPTFSGIVDKANASAALQEAQNTYKLYLGLVDYANNEEVITNGFIQLKSGDYVELVDGKVQSEIITYNYSDFMGKKVIDLEGNVSEINIDRNEPQ